MSVQYKTCDIYLYYDSSRSCFRDYCDNSINMVWLSFTYAFILFMLNYVPKFSSKNITFKCIKFHFYLCTPYFFHCGACCVPPKQTFVAHFSLFQQRLITWRGQQLSLASCTIINTNILFNCNMK